MSLDKDKMREKIIEEIRKVYDPEIPINIYELGLIYNIDIADDGRVIVSMTLTSPNCPEAQTIPIRVEQTVMDAEGVTSCKVEITWDPPWGPEKMTEAAKLELGLM